MMRKLGVQDFQRNSTEPNKLARPSENDSELIAALQSENKRLRDLVFYLSAAILRSIAPEPDREPSVFSSADVKELNRALNVLSKPFSGHELLTPRENAVLEQIVKGASNKECARTLAISARTVEFHRANIMFKLAAKNTTELVRIVLGE